MEEHTSLMGVSAPSTNFYNVELMSNFGSIINDLVSPFSSSSNDSVEQLPTTLASNWRDRSAWHYFPSHYDTAMIGASGLSNTNASAITDMQGPIVDTGVDSSTTFRPYFDIKTDFNSCKGEFHKPIDPTKYCLADCFVQYTLPIVLILISLLRNTIRMHHDSKTASVRTNFSYAKFRSAIFFQVLFSIPLLWNTVSPNNKSDMNLLPFGLGAVFLMTAIMPPFAYAVHSKFVWALIATWRLTLISNLGAHIWAALAGDVIGHLHLVTKLQWTGLFCDIMGFMLAGVAINHLFKIMGQAGLARMVVAHTTELEAIEDAADVDELRKRLQTKSSPEEKCGFLGWVFFSWFSPVVKLCYDKDRAGEQLRMEEVPALPAQDLATIHYLRLKQEWDKELKDHPQSPSLIHALTRCFVHETLFGWAGILKLANDVLHFLNPFLLNHLLKFLNDDTLADDNFLGWSLAIGMCVVTLLQSLAMVHYFQRGYRAGMHVRSALITLVYQKSLRLVPGVIEKKNSAQVDREMFLRNQAGRTHWVQRLLSAFLPANPGKSDYEGSIGQIMNLVTADTDRFSFVMPYLNLLWSAPFQLILCFIFLGHYVQWGMLGGLAVIALSFFVSSKVQARVQALQKEVMRVKDERLKIQNELLNAVKMIKIYAWEFSLCERVREVRNREMLLQRRVRLWGGIQWLQFTIAPSVVCAATFTVWCLVLGNELDPATAFTALSLFSIIGFPLGALPMILNNLISAQVSVLRLEAFLLKPEVQGVNIDTETNGAATHDGRSRSGSSGRSLPSPENMSTPLIITGESMERTIHHASCVVGGPAELRSVVDGKHPAVEFRFKQVQWADGTPLIKNPRGLHFDFFMGDFICVVGNTGSGKTGFLTALTGELPYGCGVDKNVFRGLGTRFCAQTPWVCNKTVKENIIWNPTSGNSASSASVRGRSSFAANDYDEAEYQKTVDCSALSSDLDMLPEGGQTMIGDRGVTLSGGQKARVAIARAIYDVYQASVYIFDDVLSAVDSHVAEHLRHEVFFGRLKGKCIVLATHDERTIQMATKIIYIGTPRSESASTENVRQEAADIQMFSSYAAYRSAIPEESFSSASDHEESSDATQGLQKTHSVASSEKKPRHGSKDSTETHEKETAVEDKKTKTTVPVNTKDEERAKGNVSWEVYKHYLICAGGWKWAFAFFFVMIAAEGTTVISNSWISYWSDHADVIPSQEGLAVYFGITCFSATMFLSFILYRVTMGQNAARRLHMDCQNHVLRAKMAWLDVTPTGRIINRFAEDTVILDNNLPMTMSLNAQWIFRLVMIFVLAATVTPWTLLLFIPIWVIFVKTQRYYIPSARDLRRLDTINKSPIFSHIGETLHGLSTIRIHKLEKIVSKACLEKLENQLQVYFLANCANRWLSLRMQLTGTMLVSGVCFFAILFRSSLAAGIVGLAIMYSLKLTDTLNALNRESADLETQMISAERMKQYADPEVVPLEAALETVQDTEDARARVEWPTRGRVEFHDLHIRYRDELPLVLKGISLSVPAGTSLGVCGRTGSGKSTLMLSLMRMIEPYRGHQVIDARDLSTFGLHRLRRNLMIIPQDPVIFSGSIRFNLDPFKECSDERLLEALQLSQLDVKLGTNLDAEVSEGGSNFSHGERQLIALARAILRKPENRSFGAAGAGGITGKNFNGILLLDEATSALDPELDRTIQNVIRQYFSTSTVITIAHRIATIMDYDAIAVFDQGKVVEYGDPKKLLKNPKGKFAALAKGAQTGSSNNLQKLAGK